jgi:recombination protein RecA
MARRLKSTSLAPGASENRERLAALGEVASEFKDWRPRAEVIKNVEAVPTIFPDYDRATGVGGHPISRFALVHGPSNEGKTSFHLGLGLSFLKRGHFFAFADAERTTPDKWVRELMAEAADHPAFVALPVKSYEQVRKGVRDLCDKVATAREKGRLPPDTTGLIVIDSIRKLVPEKLWKNLTASLGTTDKRRDKGVDGFGGRAGQLKAALNAAWVDELIPLLADTRMAMVVIARETKDVDAETDLFATRDWKTGGGAALFYESSVAVRVTRDWVTEGKEKDRKLVGERHRLEIHKTKIAGKSVKVPAAYFHTSNGAATPAGFDLARDVLELGLEHGVLRTVGSYVKLGRASLGQGKVAAHRRISEDVALLARLEAAVREK